MTLIEGGVELSTSDVLLTVVYMAYLLSPALRDEFFLRVALMITSLGFILWGVLIDNTVTVIANVLFVLIGARHIIRLYKQRQPVELNDTQRRINEEIFEAMSAREFLLFWHLGDEDFVESGELIRKDEKLDDVLVITRGDVIIELDSGDLVKEAPILLGEMSYALGVDAAATATVRCEGEVEMRRWTKTTLRDLQRSHPDLAVPFLRSIGSNLAAKFR